MGETPLEGVAREELEQRLALALAVGDTEAAAEVEIRLSRCLLDAAESEAARRHAERAVALQRQRADEHDLGRALEVFGHAARALGDQPTATQAYLEAIDLETRHGHRHTVASLLGALGDMAESSGDRERARDLMSAALRTAPEARDDGARRAELALARMELEDGDDKAAARRALRVLQSGATGDLALGGALVLRDAGLAARRRDDNEAARRRYEFALPVLRAQGDPDVVVALLAALAGACRAGGDPSAARGYFEEALARTDDWADGQGRSVDVRASLLHDLGSLALDDLGDARAAVGWLEQALAAADGAGDLQRSAEVLARLAAASRAAGDRPAAEHWRAARARAEFLAAVGRAVDRLLPRAGVGEVSGLILGDTGRKPETLRLPGGKVGDGLLWRRRLAAEVRRGAPQRRVAVVFGGPSDQLDDVLRRGVAGEPRAEALRLVLVEADCVEERVARVERGEKGVACERWVPVAAGASPGELGGQRQRLVEALRAALG